MVNNQINERQDAFYQVPLRLTVGSRPLPKHTVTMMSVERIQTAWKTDVPTLEMAPGVLPEPRRENQQSDAETQHRFVCNGRLVGWLVGCAARLSRDRNG